MKVRSMVFVLMLVLVAGCESATAPHGLLLRDLGPVPDGAFTTDSTGYVAREFAYFFEQPRYRFTVVSRYQNRGAAPLYLGRCYVDSPQPIFSVEWAETSPVVESAYRHIWGCVGHDRQFELAPGAVRIDTLEVQGPNGFDGRTNRPFGVTQGAFRVHFDVRLAKGDGAPSAPVELRRTNAFIVRTLNAAR